jgi:DNA-binding transcriptional LysR family regulator
VLETRHLRYFVAVAEEHHFGRAAERLRMAQPPLSQQIRQLERILGIELLTRTTRHVAVNPAGELLLVRGRRVLEELQSIEEDVRRVGEGMQGTVRLGFTGAATYGIMPRILREAARQFDGISLSVIGELLTPRLVAELQSHRIDVAVLRPPINAQGIAHTVIARERIVAALPAESPLAEREILTMSDFADRVLVGYPQDATVSQALAARWLEHRIRPQYAQRVSETSTLMSLVAAGVGIALVPETATSINLGATVIREIADSPDVELAVAWRLDETSRAVQRIVPFIERLISAENGVRR